VGVRRLKRRAARAVAGLFAAWAAIVCGAALAWGVGYAFIVGGALLGAYLLVIYDVDDVDTEPVETGPVVASVHPLHTLMREMHEQDLGGEP
jgi:hypothetical protein